MSHEEEKGATKQVKGELREAAGILTDNRKMQAKGKLEKTEGKAQEKTWPHETHKLNEDDDEDI